MKIRINIENISKSFGNQKVIKDFSFSFDNRGLYVLFGESGSGKTTLLNIICGVTTFDNGNVYIFNKCFNKKVNENFAQDYIAYITQNDFFVDYLTIYDNLLLSADKESKKLINQYLKKFKIYDLKNRYPAEISGGESARVSLIMALLSNKKIIIMDEPTASLDLENKKIIFEILNELKKENLIICATHDGDLKTLADEVMYFPVEKNKIKKFELENIPLKEKKSKVNLLPFFLKQFVYKKREKKSAIYFIISLLVVFLIIYFIFDSNSKVRLGLIDYNQIRFVNYYCSVNTGDYCENILKDYDVLDNVYLYESNLPTPEIVINEYGVEEIKITYDGSYRTLPFDKNLFPFQNLISEGRYFENNNEVIIGYDVAISKTKNIKSLIGTEISLSLPDGEDTFIIVGIFKNITEDNLYFQYLSGLKSPNNYIFLNSKYLEKYKYDDIIANNEEDGERKSVMQVYFSNVLDLNKFYSKYTGKDISSDNPIRIEEFYWHFPEYDNFIGSMDDYLKPVILVIFFISLIFYFQNERIKNYYRSHILAVYNYYGYKWKNIIVNNIFSSIINITLLYIIAFIISVIFSSLVNYIFLKYNLSSFPLFLIDKTLLVILYICLLLVSIVISLINSLLLIKRGWLIVLKERDDLL